MAAYTLVVTSDPTPGMEKAYNIWYEGHLNDVLRTPGFKSARRLKVCKGYDAGHQYLVYYEIETDDADETMARLMARAAAGEWEVSEALGPAHVALYENISPVVLAD